MPQQERSGREVRHLPKADALPNSDEFSCTADRAKQAVPGLRIPTPAHRHGAALAGQGGRMPRTPAPLPPGLGPFFSVADATRLGVARGRLRRGDLSAPFHGARRTRPDGPHIDASAPFAQDRRRRAEVHALARSYSTVMTPGSFFSGRTAAVLFGAPIEHGEDLEVAVIAPRRAPRGVGIRGRKVAQSLVSVRAYEGLPVASPASTWAMLGRDLSERELVIVGDAFVRIPRDRFGRRRPEFAVTTIEQLQAALEVGSRRSGMPRLRSALPRVRSGSASPLESEFRLDAAAAGLPEPVLDHEIRDGGGRLLGISEFAYPRFRLVVEVEGDHHRTSRAQWDRDIDKYRAYNAAGWAVERLTARNIRGHVADAAEIVRHALLRQGWDGTR